MSKFGFGEPIIFFYFIVLCFIKHDIYESVAEDIVFQKGHEFFPMSVNNDPLSINFDATEVMYIIKIINPYL